MTVAELALLITTFTGAVVALVNTRNNAGAIETLKRQLSDALDKQVNARKDIILIGESLAGTHRDIASLVVLVNKLYTDYEATTGKKPDIDWDVFDRLLTVRHSTTKLGPLQIKDDM